MTSDLDKLVDPHDRDFVAEITDPEQRDVVARSLIRYRAPDRLSVGDRMPAVAVTRLDPYGTMTLDGLVEGRPVVLVFGSYT